MKRQFSIKLEFQPRDLWVGVFWTRYTGGIDLYICLVPCLPIHFATWL